MRPLSPFTLSSATRLLALCVIGIPGIPGVLDAQTLPRDTTGRPPDSTRRFVMPRPPADTDTVRKAGTIVIPGSDLPVQVNLRMEAKTQRDRNLRCNSIEAAQLSTISGCNAGFLPPNLGFSATLRSAGLIGDRVHVNVDYDMQREFDASQTMSLYYEGRPGEKLQRVDVGNINFAAPTSRFITPSLPSGNYGAQITNQFGRLRLRTIYAKQTGNVVQNRQFILGGTSTRGSQQLVEREIDDYQIERLRFFFTIDPALFGRSYPNIDILNRSQLARLASALPDTLRPTRVLLYRLQFGAQPQNPNGPRFKLRGDLRGQQTYDLLREGVDYYMDPSMLWFALVRPLNETNERLVVAYNVRINGRDTVWTTTGGTPDLQLVSTRDQVANLVMDPTVGPSSPAFRNEIRSVYLLAGENLVRQTTKVRVVAGSGLLEHPLAGNNATFLEMFGLAKTTSPAEFDYENRIWPRTGDPVFNLGAGATDVRNGQSFDIARIIHDHFLVFPSVRPFAPRDSGGGLVVAGNPSNEAIYTIPGEYLYQPQHPSSIYRLHIEYQTAELDQPGAITLGATQMRQGSDQVTLDGRPLVRDLDYRIDYDLGRIELMRPDTLLALRRRIDVRYEENPVFVSTPTTLAGVISELPVSHGVLSFTAINQSQATSLNRPQLGFQGTSTLTAGVTGAFSWEAPALTRMVSRLPFGDSKVASRLSVQGEIASSHPQFAARNQGQAYVETFEGEGGLSIPVGDVAWSYSSLPAYGNTLRSRFGPGFFEPNRAATLTWQTNVKGFGGDQIVVTHPKIDPLATFAGTGFQFNEPLLWLTLLPLTQGGRTTPQFDWQIKNAPTSGRRFRSIRAVLSPSGIDLTRDEFLEFWTLLDTNVTTRSSNPTLVFDFGDVSENTLSFAPETLTIRRNTNGTVDSLFTGKKLQGFDRLDTERDPFSRAFNTDVNDTGLPGSVVDTLVVIDGTSVMRLTNVRICRAAPGALDALGDPRTNCTIGNNRLDEEDIDQDNAMNLFGTQRESERLLRYVVDLSDPARYKRIGGTLTDTLLVNGAIRVRTRRWVLVSVPFKAPTDSLNDVNRRRIRGVRLTVISGAGQDPDEPTQLPIAGMKVTGSPWLDRSSQTLVGVAGLRPDGGFVITSTIGTNDSSAKLVYQPPPGVGDQTDLKNGQFAAGLSQINERSMRIQAGNMPLYHRAEAFIRFPSGSQNYFGFKRLRVWGRGRGDGWGPGGDLQMYIKVGRDENNFYLFRSPVNAGQTAAAWTDFAIDFNRFIDLRSRIQKDYLAGKSESVSCTGADSAIIVASPLPSNVVAHRFAACDNGYMVYTIDPAVTAPNLAAVQEVAVGIVRVGASGGGASAVAPGDTLELWVDDIRLDQQVNSAGFAGGLNFNFNAADFADLRVNFSSKDPNFRQLGEQPSFLQQRNFDIASTIRLDKLLPKSVGLALPLTITKLSLAVDPLYLSQSDVSGKGIDALRKPKNDITTYSLTVRRTTPVDGGVLGPLINNLSATSSYVTGVNRTEFQDGNSRNFNVGLDYLVTDDSARTLHLPAWVDGVLGALPDVVQAGPISALRGSAFRWNPTQLRFSSGMVRAEDRRVSYILPSGAVDDQPASSNALSRLWRNGSVLELRPTNVLNLRWEVQSLRDLRDYRDTTAFVLAGPNQRVTRATVKPGFERERSMITDVSWSPIFSAWFRPRTEFGAQYNMLRDPNMRSFSILPGVVGVDSVLAARDSAASNLPRRMTGAQTASAGASIDLAKMFATYVQDSALAHRIGGFFAPLDVSYTRSLLSTLDASPGSAPLLLQLGLGGPRSYRTVNGVEATTAGQTGTLSAAGSLLLPWGTSFVNRYRRTATENWISRPELSQSQVNGRQTQFPDATLRWTYRPAAVTGPISNVDANVGYIKTDASIALPSLFNELPPEIRRTHVETFPIGGSVNWAVRGGLSTRAQYSFTRRIDSLPGSVARSRGNELSADAGHAFRIPARWGLGDTKDVRARFGFQDSHNATHVLDANGVVQSRLQDNGRRAINLTADTNLQDNMVFTLQGSHVVVFDNNLNRRFAQTVGSIVLQVQFYATPTPTPK